MKLNMVRLFLPLLAVLLLAEEATAQVGQIRGTVTDQQGNPLEGVEITIQGMGVRREYSVTTGNDGTFLHAGVSVQGSYRVIARKEGFQSEYVEGIRPAFGGATEGSTVEFSLRPGEGRPLDFEMTDEQREALRRRQEEQERRRARMGELQETFNQGREYFSAGQYEEALAQFQVAVEIDDSQPAVWANLGSSHAALRQYDEALDAYRRAVELKPDEASFYQNLGSIYAETGDIENAQENYAKAAEIAATSSPKDAAVSYYNMGVTFVNLGRSQEAVEAFRQAITAHPDLAEAHYQLGLTLLGLNELDDALDALKKYIEIAPEGPNVEVARQLIQELG